MKWKWAILATTCLPCWACKFKVPVTREHAIPVDTAALGLWKPLRADIEKGERDASESLLVLKFSDTEYVVEYRSKHGAMYVRVYPVKVGDARLVQLQIIGSSDGRSLADMLPDVHTGQYDLASYRVKDDVLEIKMLSETALPVYYESSEELRDAVLRGLSSAKFFLAPMRFERVKHKHEKPQDF